MDGQDLVVPAPTGQQGEHQAHCAPKSALPLSTRTVLMGLSRSCLTPSRIDELSQCAGKKNRLLHVLLTWSVRVDPLAGRSLGRGPVMTAHTHGSLSLHGAVPLRARKIWARLAKCRGCAGLCRWPVGPLSRTGPLPLEALPSCFQRPVCKQPCLLFALLFALALAKSGNAAKPAIEVAEPVETTAE